MTSTLQYMKKGMKIWLCCLPFLLLIANDTAFAAPPKAKLRLSDGNMTTEPILDIESEIDLQQENSQENSKEAATFVAPDSGEVDRVQIETERTKIQTQIEQINRSKEQLATDVRDVCITLNEHRQELDLLASVHGGKEILKFQHQIDEDKAPSGLNQRSFYYGTKWAFAHVHGALMQMQCKITAPPSNGLFVLLDNINFAPGIALARALVENAVDRVKGYQRTHALSELQRRGNPSVLASEIAMALTLKYQRELEECEGETRKDQIRILKQAFKSVELMYKELHGTIWAFFKKGEDSLTSETDPQFVERMMRVAGNRFKWVIKARLKREEARIIQLKEEERRNQEQELKARITAQEKLVKLETQKAQALAQQKVHVVIAGSTNENCSAVALKVGDWVRFEGSPYRIMGFYENGDLEVRYNDDLDYPSERVIAKKVLSINCGS